jgi:16S rRNA (adenine1518-N6/adenine1519-N6)-dimethyltransferase
MPPTLKRLGQHFLTDRSILARIADSLAPGPDDTVVEIGPGRGALTDELASRAGKVVAIEVDRALAEVLRTRYATRPSVSIVEADALEVRFADLAGDDYLIAANVPYYITTPLLFHGLQHPRARRSVYLIQREVAERLVAVPGNKVYGAITVTLQAVARVELLFGVPPRAFSPPPSVDSAVVRITPRVDPLIPAGDEEKLRKLVQGAFALRRKQMRRVMRTIMGSGAEEAEGLLAAAGLDPDARPETIPPEGFVRLLREMQSATGS